MLFGKKMGNIILKILVKCKRLLKNSLKLILYPYVIYRRKKIQERIYLKEKQDFFVQAENLKNNDYLVFFNKNWLGTQNATKELFENTIGISEIYDAKLINDIVQYILDKNIKLVIFSAFSKGWKDLIMTLKDCNQDITIKVIWHGSNAMNVEAYDWEMFETIFRLHNDNYIDSIGFVKSL